MTARLMLAFAAVHLVFAAWPPLDLAISGAFFDGAGWPAARDPALGWARARLWDASLAVFLGCAVLWAVVAARGRRAASDWRPFAFGALTMLLGPGVLVNLVLKEVWGRARPRGVAAFGGDMAFTPPVQVAGECLRNCSFVSGEASGAMGAALVAVALLAGRARWVAAGVLALAVLAGALRVAMGGHFASDVVMAWILTALVARGVWHLTRMDRAAPPRWRHVAADLRLRAGARASPPR